MLSLVYKSFSPGHLIQHFLKQHSYALVAFLFLMIAASRSAHAQVSVYGSVMFDVFGVNGDSYGDGSSKSGSGGVIGGAFYTFPSQSRFKAGIDARITYSPGYNGGSAYTAALRVGFVPNHVRLRPYFQIGGGVVSTDLNQYLCNGTTCTFSSSRITTGAAQFAFGLDVRITDHIDIRTFDYGADASGSNSGIHADVGFLDAGIVYHFRPGKT